MAYTSFKSDWGNIQYARNSEIATLQSRCINQLSDQVQHEFVRVTKYILARKNQNLDIIVEV